MVCSAEFRNDVNEKRWCRGELGSYSFPDRDKYHVLFGINESKSSYHNDHEKMKMFVFVAKPIRHSLKWLLQVLARCSVCLDCEIFFAC